ncbi:unnamed protein product [Brassicogethes aeneus]|uniref:Zinc finger CCCH-type with G patch domain-containing protein n=1 Tax=Brassicogethes aeneus TaxID=1431903 RepID=A0A9P0AZ81_BRAAE|nr:unnamed protein product [Brassicogethes aeneus]
MEEAEIYIEQLNSIENALKTSTNEAEREELLGLKNNIQELLSLTGYNGNEISSKAPRNQTLDEEYAIFMSEMTKDGAVECSSNNPRKKYDLSKIEGMKCQAPHTHQWGNTAYHNAMVCSVISEDVSDEDKIKVRVLFMNPTHKEMVPCPYYFKNECKFSEEDCHFSHGESVFLSSLQEYKEPNFENVTVGNTVLAKQKNLWHRARVKTVFDGKCLIKFESNQKVVELAFDQILPLTEKNSNESDSNSSDEDFDENERDDIINMSLMLTPGSQALGDWEKFTKGIGSKLMQQMGYIVGSGLGRRCDGRVEPVTAVILPPGKSLDHCMKLRENAGGDENLFSAERKLKRMQRKQEEISKRMYEKEKNKVDVFNLINQTLSSSSSKTQTKSEHRQEIKKETSRNLNVASLQIDENIRKVEQDLYKIRESLSRHKEEKSVVHKQLQEKLFGKQNDLKTLKTQALNIKNEQSNRNDKKKLTIF